MLGVGVGIGIRYGWIPGTGETPEAPAGFERFMVRKADNSGREPFQVRKADDSGWKDFQVRTHG
jgi:hypothetical protein